MLFSELKIKYRGYSYLSEFKTVKEAKEIGWIPPVYIEEPDSGAFPDHCVCGSENIVNEKLTRCMCCDPRCPIKSGLALSELFTRFKIKGLGDEVCKEIFNLALPKLQTGSYVEVLSLTEDDFPDYFVFSARGELFFRSLAKIKKEKYTFLEMVGNLGLPSIGSNVSKSLEGIESGIQLEREIGCIEDIEMFCLERGIQDVEFIYNLRVFLPDILVGEAILSESMRRTGLQTVNVCITGRVNCNGVSMTKKDFISMCNRCSIDDSGVQLFEIKMTQALESVNYIIADSKSNSAKYRAGLRRGVLITSNDFVSKIEEEVKKWNQKKNRTAETSH